MELKNIDLNRADLHLHTVASDGEMRAEEIIHTSRRIGLKTISITDHDGIGAYRGRAEMLMENARKLGVELITGIELDSEYRGVEIHILGYGIDVENNVLQNHLAEIHPLRKKRIREIMEKVNRELGEGFMTDKEIFPPYRETLMKPHVVRELLKKGEFAAYRDASKWISEKCQSDTIVPKLPPEKIIGVILESGGIPVLAHPAYYIGVNGIELDKMITDLSSSGLAGVEVYYDYYGLSPSQFNKQNHAELISMIRDTAGKYGLVATRGSDSHTLEELVGRNSQEPV